MSPIVERKERYSKLLTGQREGEKQTQIIRRMAGWRGEKKKERRTRMKIIRPFNHNPVSRKNTGSINRKSRPEKTQDDRAVKGLEGNKSRLKQEGRSLEGNFTWEGRDR